jgi:hypothetical protein
MSASRKRDVWQPDMSQVDDLAVEFACNGTRMRLNKDERIIAVRRMIGVRPPHEIAELIGTFKEEIGRIAKTTPGTLLCPFCRQHAYADDDVLRRHIDSRGQQWCPQSGKHKNVRAETVQRLIRPGSRMASALHGGA